MKANPIISFTLLTVCLFGCAKSSRNGAQEATDLIASRIDHVIEVQQGCYGDDRIQAILQKMLSQQMSSDVVVQIALLNNPRIQEALENIGIAQADLIEAGLLSNPIFGSFVRYPDKKGYFVDAEISVMQNFLNLFLIPLRTRMATAGLQQAIYETSQKIINLSFEVEETYYLLAAAYQRVDILKKMIEISEIESEITLAQYRVGNVNPLEHQLRTADYLAKVAELPQAEKEIIHYREKLNILMGLTHPSICWSISAELPSLPICEPSLECLEQIAINERLDLQAARWEIERYKRSFPTIEWWALTDLQVGISSEREPEGERVTGPQFSAVLPIFNWGQGAKKRLWAQFQQAKHRLAALEIEAAAEVRQAKEELVIFRNQAMLYQNRILPNQENIFNSSRALYNVMGTGIFELLDNKRNCLQAYLNYTLALRSYWQARIRLDRAIGGKLNIMQAGIQEDGCAEGVGI